MKMIGNVSDWLSYAGGALIKVADSAGSTVVHLGPFVQNFVSLMLSLSPQFVNYISTSKANALQRILTFFSTRNKCICNIAI